MPRVSIPIPICNRAHLFKVALQSALPQTWQDFEILVSENACAFYSLDCGQPYLQNHLYVAKPPYNIATVRLVLKSAEETREYGPGDP
jgi:hypothetical protein